MSRANGITRREILYQLKQEGPLTADQLSQQLGISPVAVRQHLQTLEIENYIGITVIRKGLGRPSHRYYLTEQGDETFPRRYAELANNLLNALVEWQGRDSMQELVYRSTNPAIDLNGRLQSGSLRDKLHELAHALNEDGHMAEVQEAETGAFRLVKRNCTLCAVARRFRDVCCRTNVGRYQDMLPEASICLEETIADGATVCSFLITAKSEG